MSVALKLFDNYYINTNFLPSSIQYEQFDIDFIDEYFVVSKTLDNQIISYYKDNIWDFTPYISNPSQPALFNFEKRIPKDHILDIKKLLLLLIFFGSGKNNSQYSVSTLHHYFDEILTPIAKFATDKTISVKHVLENNSNLINFINTSCKDRSKTQSTISFLSFLNTQQNHITKIKFQYDKNVKSYLKKLYETYSTNLSQTELIPSRILFQSIQQRWIQIDEIENNLNNIVNFLEEYLSTDKYCEIISITKKKQKKFNDKIEWINFINKHNLEKLFKKYFDEKEIEYKDFGAYSKDRVDYPIIAKQVAKAVQNKDTDRGILICRSGYGMAMVANKFKGIRSAPCFCEEAAKFSRLHNDTNVLALGADYITTGEAIAIVRMWIGTEFEGGRHKERLDMVAEIENENMK